MKICFKCGKALTEDEGTEIFDDEHDASVGFLCDFCLENEYETDEHICESEQIN